MTARKLSIGLVGHDRASLVGIERQLGKVGGPLGGAMEFHTYVMSQESCKHVTEEVTRKTDHDMYLVEFGLPGGNTGYDFGILLHHQRPVPVISMNNISPRAGATEQKIAADVEDRAHKYGDALLEEINRVKDELRRLQEKRSYQPAEIEGIVSDAFESFGVMESLTRRARDDQIRLAGRVVEREMTLNGLSTGVFAGAWDGRDTIGELAKLIAAQAYKEVNVGIVGFGEFGTEVMKQMLLLPEVRTIRGLTRKRPKEQILTHLELPTGAPREAPAIDMDNLSKLVFVDNIEGVLEGTDILFYCTSSMRRREANKHRREDLLGFEIAERLEDFKQIRRAGYQGLILNYTNPVAEIMECMCRVGISPSQVTSTFENDSNRISIPLRANPRYRHDRAFREFVSEAEAKWIIGQHGNPVLVAPPHRDKFLSALDFAFVTWAQNFAREIGDRAQAVSGASGINYFLPQWATPVFVKTIARFRQPKRPLFCRQEVHLNGRVYRGFLALPATISYHPQFGVHLNERAVNEIGADRIFYEGSGPKFAENLLKPQQTRLNEALRHERIRLPSVPYREF